VTAADSFTIEHVAKGIRLVHSPEKLFDQSRRVAPRLFPPIFAEPLLF
jgi:hypothetical protein